MAKIDRVEDLPDWFDLDEYQGCEDFGAAEWYREISRRRNLLEAHPDNISLPRLAQHGLWLDIWRSLILQPAALVRDNPIDPTSKRDYSGPESQPVRAVNTFDLAMQAYRDEMAMREGLCGPEMPNRWAAICRNDFPYSSAAKLLGLPIEIDAYNPGALPSPIIKVDLGASDSVLKEAFAAWLKEARSSQQNNASRPSKPLYDRWARYGVLPYLDLWIWSRETETHIPDRVMSAAISRYDAGEANLRKTVAPLADSLMRDLSALRALAAVESAAMSKANPETFRG